MVTLPSRNLPATAARSALELLRLSARAALFAAIALPARAEPASPASPAATATVTVRAASPLGAIDPGIYGQYLEHVQAADECIYPSLWDDASTRSDRMGLRTDVMDAVRRLRVPAVRWPGGCFADVYHWEQGVGPRADRPTVPNLHWGGTESNQFGTDEFLAWCRQTGAEPYVNVNLGSGTLEEALRWLEYCNGGPETEQGARRARNGRTEPWNVRTWGIGNETWGPWETGHTDADTYGRQLAKWARAMREKDPSVRIFAVGSEEGNDSAWDATVLGHAAPWIDCLTIHAYGISAIPSDAAEYEAVAYTPVYLEDRMRRMLRTIDAATSSPSSRPGAEPIRIALDEWNIRHYRGKDLVRRDPRTMQDAVFVAGVLNAMVRLSPRVAMGNYVFLVNGNSTLLVDADQVIETPIAHVFGQYARWMTGRALATRVDGPGRVPPDPRIAHPGRLPGPDYRPAETPCLDAAAALRSDGAIAVSLINRHPTDKTEAVLQLPAGYTIAAAWTLSADAPGAANDFQYPDRVAPRTRNVEPARTSWTCEPRSVVLLQCAASASP